MAEREPERRDTPQRRAIADALRGTTEFVSAQELHARLRDGGSRIGLATVYRALSALVDDGAVDALRSTDGEQRYRWCDSTAHHHHLVCRQCGRTVEIEAAAVERWAAALATQHGFTELSHTVEVFGRCPDCA